MALCMIYPASTLTHWGQDKMAAVSQTTLSNAFSWMKMRISIKISLKFVPKGPINNNPSLVQVMAWRRSGDKPLSEPMMVNLLKHIYVTQPQWVKLIHIKFALNICGNNVHEWTTNPAYKQNGICKQRGYINGIIHCALLLLRKKGS